jgi:hypothetical protein
LAICSPDPPPPPNYQAAAKEQGAANIEAARVQGKLNNPNVVSPYGTQTVAYGAGGDPDQVTFTQQFSPEQQAIFEAANRSKLSLSNLAEKGAGAAGEVIGKNVDLSGMPPAAGQSEDARKRVLAAMMSRVNEDYGRQSDDLNSNLIAAGLRPGTKAYDDQMALLARKRTDANTQAELASQNAMASQFGLDTQARKDAIAEYLMSRQVPLNEVTALMSGSQVSNPFAMPSYAQNAQVGAAPVYAATADAANYASDLYNVKAQQAGNLQSGLFSLGGAALMGGGMALSDRRLKTNIQRVGTHYLGIGIYAYDIAGRHERGVMADELLVVKPNAVMRYPDGYYRVDYAQIGGRP